MHRLLALAALLLALPAGAQQRAENVAVGASGMGQADGPFTLYSLAENRVVPNADSASTAWDLGFRGTTIIVNGGQSGPGAGAALVVEAPYAEVTAVPEADLLADGDRDCPRGGPLAICTGSGNGWYLYSGNGITPLEDRTLVVRPAAGGPLVKVRVESYTLSDPQPDGSRPRYYTFEYEALGAHEGHGSHEGGAHGDHGSHDGH